MKFKEAVSKFKENILSIKTNQNKEVIKLQDAIDKMDKEIQDLKAKYAKNYDVAILNTISDKTVEKNTLEQKLEAMKKVIEDIGVESKVSGNFKQDMDEAFEPVVKLEKEYRAMLDDLFAKGDELIEAVKKCSLDICEIRRDFKMLDIETRNVLRSALGENRSHLNSLEKGCYANKILDKTNRVIGSLHNLPGLPSAIDLDVQEAREARAKVQ